MVCCSLATLIPHLCSIRTVDDPPPRASYTPFPGPENQPGNGAAYTPAVPLLKPGWPTQDSQQRPAGMPTQKPSGGGVFAEVGNGRQIGSGASTPRVDPSPFATEVSLQVGKCAAEARNLLCGRKECRFADHFSKTRINKK